MSTKNPVRTTVLGRWDMIVDGATTELLTGWVLPVPRQHAARARASYAVTSVELALDTFCQIGADRNCWVALAGDRWLPLSCIQVLSVTQPVGRGRVRSSRASRAAAEAALRWGNHCNFHAPGGNGPALGPVMPELPGGVGIPLGAIPNAGFIPVAQWKDTTAEEYAAEMVRAAEHAAEVQGRKLRPTALRSLWAAATENAVDLVQDEQEALLIHASDYQGVDYPISAPLRNVLAVVGTQFVVLTSAEFQRVFAPDEAVRDT